MKTTTWIFPLVLMGVLLMLELSCKKDMEDNNNPASSGTIKAAYGNVLKPLSCKFR
jgi:hypothetical protein